MHYTYVSNIRLSLYYNSGNFLFQIFILKQLRMNVIMNNCNVSLSLLYQLQNVESSIKKWKKKLWWKLRYSAIIKTRFMTCFWVFPLDIWNVCSAFFLLWRMNFLQVRYVFLIDYLCKCTVSFEVGLTIVSFVSR